MNKNERIDRANELMSAIGAWGFQESDTDEIIFRVVAVLFASDTITIDWDSEFAGLLLDIVDDNWDNFQGWKEKVLKG